MLRHTPGEREAVALRENGGTEKPATSDLACS